MTETRLKHWTLILFPVFLALYLYRRSFRIWFMADDFAWLGLGLGIFHPSDIPTALFAPMAQGTVRTLSERLFFLGFERTFGLESLPMRLASFATLALGMMLLSLIVRRLSGSAVAGALAAVLWSLNFGVSIAMSWLSSYNQILLSTLFLASFYCFLRYADGRRTAWLAGSWLAYLLGFGALESVIVLPAVLLIWTYWFDRSATRLTLPFFIPAIAFTLAHLFLIPKAKDAPAYRMYFDVSLFQSIGIYWDWLLGAAPLLNFDPTYWWMLQLSRFILTPALVAFVVWRTWRRDWLPLFCVLISLALIAPMLPLRDHRTDYYLASASLGIVALLAIVPGRLHGLLGHLSWVLIVIYVTPSFIVQQSAFEWYLARTAPIRPLIRGLQHAASVHPGKLILLEGISEAVYYSALADDALRLIPGAEIRLIPGSLPAGNPLALAPSTARAAFESQSVVLYHFDGTQLKDVTREWERTKALALDSGLSPELLAGDPAFDSQFLEGWYPSENSHRWMGAKGIVRLGGPFAAAAALTFEAFAPPAIGSFDLKITANGVQVHAARHSAGPVEITIPLPLALIEATELRIEISSSKTVRPSNDNRTLSLLASRIAVK